MSNRISIESIPHDKQRYPTVGDWITHENGDLDIKVSEMSDPRFELLVGIHELIEVSLCRHRKISQAEVDAFDLKFEKEREAGKHSPTEEPGDNPLAPYQKEHFFATNLERLIAAELGVDWGVYEREVESL